MSSYLYSWLDDILFSVEKLAKRGQRVIRRRKWKQDDFAHCVDDGFKTRSGIVVAKWDFVLQEDMEIGKHLYRKGKRYFALSEVKELVVANALPEGWHLPSAEEWRLLIADFNGDTEFMAQCLCMDVAGFIPSKAALQRYNESPEDIHWVSWDGCYRLMYPEYKFWTSVPALYFDKREQVHTCVGDDGGYCLRLFKN